MYIDTIKGHNLIRTACSTHSHRCLSHKENLRKWSIQERLLIFMTSRTTRVFQIPDFAMQPHVCVAGSWSET